MSSSIELNNVSHGFQVNKDRITLFNRLNLSIHQGQTTSLVGPSGSGKSTLLSLLGGLEEPTSGSVVYYKSGQSQPLFLLKQHSGFIFQQFHLLPELDALSNVLLPLKLRGDKDALKKAKRWLKRVSMEHRFQHRPHQLSGGEQQRIAIARALCTEPDFVFADEPTGNLDAQTARTIAELLMELASERNVGLVLVTHNENMAQQCDRRYYLNQGALSMFHDKEEEQHETE